MLTRKPSITIFLLILLLLIPLVAQAQDAVMYPDLTGPYYVSRSFMPLLDEARDEVFTPDPDDKRELLLTLYYPADLDAEANQALYVDGALQQVIAEQLGVNPRIFELVYAQAYEESPVAAAQATYPVLIFSPGMGNLPLYYTNTLEQLASSGYIVIAISHPYSTAATALTADRVVLANELGTPQSADPQERERLGAVWVGDIEFVLNQLTEMNTSDPLLAGRLDLEHIGAFGHSFGGATVVQAAYEDSRIKAVINMDGTLYGDVAEAGLALPFMLMRSDTVSVSDGPLHELLAQATPGYFFQLAGSAHNTYTTDFLLNQPLFPHILGPEMIGTLDSLRALEIINTYVQTFFDTYLKGTDSLLLGGPTSAFPEVSLEVLGTE